MGHSFLEFGDNVVRLNDGDIECAVIVIRECVSSLKLNPEVSKVLKDYFELVELGVPGLMGFLLKPESETGIGRY